jgi:1-acyl-sn-glycerol-3-phosphate acyltransferase
MILKLLHAIIGYTFIGIVMVIGFIPCLIIAALPARWRYDNRFYYWVTNLIYKAAIFAAWVPVSVEGADNIPHQPAIIVANHQSSFDIPLVGAQLGGKPHFWLFLSRFTKVPVFGFIARRMNVVVDLSHAGRKMFALTEGLSWTKKYKSHLILFPEGGRYLDGKIHDFFQGFAIIAQATGRPVVQVLLVNVNKVYPPGSFFIERVPVKIIIGKPFMSEMDETREHFAERVRQWFVAQL